MTKSYEKNNSEALFMLATIIMIKINRIKKDDLNKNLKKIYTSLQEKYRLIQLTRKLRKIYKPN